MAWQTLFGERATTKIAAIFDTESGAASAAATLHSAVGLHTTQLRLVKPYEKGYSKKLEPESRGIVRTAVRAHLILGAAGAVAGAILWCVLYALELPAIVSSPRASAGAILFFSVIGGMLLGGLITARPDHQLVIQRVQEATQDGRWSLVVHPRSPRQCDAVMDTLARLGPEIVRSV
ncbi:hypothetical protein [Pollutimonas sp. M17]|uniref:hypothetical protein n=1 Tax=Pollutimonas sp. M17 TaxID=2962065 RepID=UPI0021F44E40|nr:hypothetical protein [Pollutimonas sp. M17]UYO92462.1 hypothetical protein OEG81_11095 [Pollutimonas sp. M17]HWK69844.1 hypothetical protein [Burkholderiaceae bacterium]